MFGLISADIVVVGEGKSLKLANAITFLTAERAREKQKELSNMLEIAIPGGPGPALTHPLNSRHGPRCLLSV